MIERRPKNESRSSRPRAHRRSGRTWGAARRVVRAGQPLRNADLINPEIVLKNDTVVTLNYEVPGIVLTMRGKALESGAEGDMVSVLTSKKRSSAFAPPNACGWTVAS